MKSTPIAAVAPSAPGTILSLLRRFPFSWMASIGLDITARFAKAFFASAIVIVILAESTPALPDAPLPTGLPAWKAWLLALYPLAALCDYGARRIVLAMERAYATGRQEIGLFYTASGLLTNGAIFIAFAAACLALAAVPTLVVLVLIVIVCALLARFAGTTKNITGADFFRGGAHARALISLAGDLMLGAALLIVYLSGVASDLAARLSYLAIAYLLFLRYMMLGLNAALINFQRLDMTVRSSTKAKPDELEEL